MKCCDYAKLGHYFNIMMPSKKSELINFQPLNNYNAVKENFSECNEEEKKYCSSYGKKCVINSNREAICEVGSTDKYQKNMVKMQN